MVYLSVRKTKTKLPNNQNKSSKLRSLLADHSFGLRLNMLFVPRSSKDSPK